MRVALTVDVDLAVDVDVDLDVDLDFDLDFDFDFEFDGLRRGYGSRASGGSGGRELASRSGREPSAPPL